MLGSNVAYTTFDHVSYSDACPERRTRPQKMGIAVLLAAGQTHGFVGSTFFSFNIC
jgi:hypothetical protein